MTKEIVNAMKKIFKFSLAFALSVITLFSCSKEQTISEQPQDLVTITLSAEKAGLNTKTAADIGASDVSYIWTDEDLSNIKLFKVETVTNGEEVTETVTEISNPTILKVNDTKLTISAQVEQNATYTFRAYLCDPESYTGSGNNYNDYNRKPKIKNKQNPKTDNYDPTADILVSDDNEVVVGNDGSTTGNMLLTFRRQVVVSQMTLKNLTAGEKISKVVISSDKHLTGYFNKTSMNGDGKTITLNYDNAVVPSNGQFPVYFTSMANQEETLSVEVTTDQYIYSKEFSKTLNFTLGTFTKFGVLLPAGIPNVSLTLPVSDPMDWAIHGSDVSTELTLSQIPVTQNSIKVYSDVYKAYLGTDGLKLGTQNDDGYIITNNIDLSSAFNIAVKAKTYGSDVSYLEFLLDGASVYTTEAALTNSYQYYYVNIPQGTGTSSSKVTVKVTGKRGYIKDLNIKAGQFIAPPVINVTSNNPMSIAATGGSQTINYSIVNSVEGTALSASSEATWISGITVNSNTVTFNVAAQEAGAAARTGIITLSYVGADDVQIEVNQAAGAGGSTTKTYVFTSKDWNATLNGVAANWTNGKSGNQLTSNQGVQITIGTSGAYAISPEEYSNIEKIEVTYCTNKSSGAGTIVMQVGNNTEKTFSVTKPSSEGTTLKTCTFNYSPKESGSVKLTANCTTNSIFIYSIAITYSSSGSGGSNDDITISSADVVTESGYKAYSTNVDDRNWIITFGGNNKSVGTNSGNRSRCNLSSYSEYAISPVTTSSVASAFACTTSLSNISKIKYTFNGGSNQTNTKVYLLYSSNGDTFSQISLTSGTQGAAISSGTEFAFSKCSGFFVVLFVATNESGAWRIDDVNLEFTVSN